MNSVKDSTIIVFINSCSPSVLDDEKLIHDNYTVVSFISTIVYIYIQVRVNTMIQYQPRLHIIESNSIDLNQPEKIHVFLLQPTRFIPVTSYMNEAVSNSLNAFYNPTRIIYVIELL